MINQKALQSKFKDYGPKSTSPDDYDARGYTGREAAINLMGRRVKVTTPDGEKKVLRSLGEAAALVGVAKATIRYHINTETPVNGYMIADP